MLEEIFDMGIGIVSLDRYVIFMVHENLYFLYFDILNTISDIHTVRNIKHFGET